MEGSMLLLVRLFSVLSKGSCIDSSGVVGVDDTSSGCFIRGEVESCVEAWDEPWSCELSLDSSSGVPGRSVEVKGGIADIGDSASYVGVREVNQGCARI